MTLDAIYPARCLTCGDVVESDFGLCGPCWRDTSFIGGTVCDACGVPLLGGDDDVMPKCDACLKEPRPWTQGRAALLYGDNGRKMVLSLKHGDRQEVAHPAGLWMAAAVKDIITPEMLIVPVPLHWQRMMKRRYNQSALLANALARRTGLSLGVDVLQRIRRTRSLDGLGRTERVAIVANAIRVHPRRRHRLAGRPVLLVDDVMTTGATLAACAAACLDAGCSTVNVVTLARAVKDA